MSTRLYVIEDDLFFVQRARTVATGAGLDAVMLSPTAALERSWEPGSVVAVQVTLNPERQLVLIERLLQARPSPRVIAVTGHLETELRARAKALGAVLAAHSSMERVFKRACQLNDRGDRGDRAETRPS